MNLTEFLKKHTPDVTYDQLWTRMSKSKIIEKSPLLRTEEDYFSFVTDVEHPQGRIKVKDYVSVAEIARINGVSRQAVHSKLQRNKVSYKRELGATWVHRDYVDKLYPGTLDKGRTQ